MFVWPKYFGMKQYSSSVGTNTSLKLSVNAAYRRLHSIGQASLLSCARKWTYQKLGNAVEKDMVMRNRVQMFSSK
jgi:hypothetical protein